MSRQGDQPKSMAWRIIRRLESGQTQKVVADAVRMARLRNQFREKVFNVDLEKVVYVLPQQVYTVNRARRDRTAKVS
ncbi:hypothetical protein TNCV_1259181 [Trichonephila clavipes]|nr:hypothetical protein TNCV_1259181 [Trichonephila clavipes]